MSEQLELGHRDPKPAKRSAVEDMCKCGHDVREHTANGKGCFRCGVECKRFRSRSRKPPELPRELAAPPGSIVLMRPDTKRPKAMGWALIEASSVRIFLDHLKTKSPNATRHFMHAKLSPARMQAMHAAIANANKAQCERAMSAVEQCLPHLEDVLGVKPSSIKVARISRGRLDDDNLVGALKYIRDGIAEALLVDDKTFALGRDFFCEQRSAGKAGVFGVLIEIMWGAP